jgi:hypothetical protein
LLIMKEACGKDRESDVNIAAGPRVIRSVIEGIIFMVPEMCV